MITATVYPASGTTIGNGDAYAYAMFGNAVISVKNHGDHMILEANNCVLEDAANSHNVVIHNVS